ncbi:MAG: TRAP transporter large permease subunit [Chloroherpetonaceae bacterium]|nr:TRAP transporter large permease subunit [Chloroherpetonaceae bacterium]MCS7211775.1 TRAP transporter large permease subunit [Chloroherpetonaceae bacterium]MDW8020468.1 TRAP transporter large permease subunit [Chloroherpetonaceae bacterium]
MSSELLTLLLFLLLFAGLLLGFPVAFTLGGLSVIFGLFAFGFDFFNLLPLRIYGIMNNYVLIAVPLFVFMGSMLEKSGIAERLLDTMALIMGRLRGGLALSVVIVGAMLGATTGVVGATVTTMGLLSLPTMLRRGFSKSLATGTIAAAGTLGQLVPPSVVMVLLGSVMNVSVGDLFAAALIPSGLLVGGYLLYIIFLAYLRPQEAPSVDAAELKEFWSEGIVRRIVRALVLPFLLVLAVLGSIYAGIATPTEAAAVGAAVSMVLTAIEGKLNWQVVLETCKQTTFLTSMVFIILVGATAFGLVFRGIGGDSVMVSLIERSNLSPMLFLALVLAGIFLAGCFIDFIEIIFIFVPVITPLLVKYEMNLVWVAILITVMLQTSFLTPPFGFTLFYLKGVAPASVQTADIYRGVVPFIIIQIIVVAVILAVPELGSFVPKSTRAALP